MVYAYLHELAYPMQKGRGQLLTSTSPGSTNTPSKKSTLRQAILPYCKNYCDVSSLHGIHYVTDIKRPRFERIIWMLLLIATTCSCIYVYSDMADLYHSQRIETIVQDSMTPIFIRPFPSIGICPRNRINWPKLLKADQLFLPPNATAVAVRTFRQFFAILSTSQFGDFFYLKPLTELELDLSLLDNVDIAEVMRHVSLTCDEFFEQPCYWQQIGYNCCELFSLERTENGFCFVFNSLVTEMDRERQRKDRYYPYHNSKDSVRSGLYVVVNLDGSKRHPNYTGPIGVNLMVKLTDQWHSTARFIRQSTDSTVTVNAQLTVTDERTRSSTPKERKCLFEDEDEHPLYKTLPGLKYRRSNCFTRCRQEYTFNYCKCNMDLFFPHDPNDLFNADHHVLESKYLDNVSNGSMICECLSSCDQMIFVTNYISSPWEGNNTTSVVKQARLDVHYASAYMMTYCTRLRYTFVELLANFGGIMGFFMGASLISCVELVYYFTVRLYTHLREGGYIPDGCLYSRESTDKKTYLRRKNRPRQGKRFLKSLKPAPITPYFRH
ncbi:PREDICTED: pickpocket protein 19-like isoform X2 [Rhagoletis zephyria]|uniref:pickpocket protein 19-like isoform X2 n=1 Tax=Rhagoletis zephyria TaxID=28612 RepID=UPI0008114DFF|nr:PREDICTED: pickpocket protein 19-like isoform X2 [Rhagoletis zephyria]